MKVYMLWDGDNTKLIFILKGLYTIIINYVALAMSVHRGEGGDNYPDIMCRANFTEQVMNPPLLYDLDRDPSEYYPLNTSLPIYADIVEHMTRVSII